MPKTVNHDERRAVVLTATWRVIQRLGIDGTTVREIAREAGVSTGSMAHYFKNKDELLRMALELADAHVSERIHAIRDAMPAHLSLREVLLQALPLDDEREIELTLDVNFWARALNNRRLRALQHADHDAWRATVLACVHDALAGGSMVSDAPAEDITDVLVAFVDGIGLQALVYPELITGARVEQLLDVTLAALGARPTP